MQTITQEYPRGLELNLWHAHEGAPKCCKVVTLSSPLGMSFLLRVYMSYNYGNIRLTPYTYGPGKRALHVAIPIIS